MEITTSGRSTANPNGSPDALMDRLFQKLALMYGAAWADKWAGTPIDAVKGEWARSLHGVEPEAMRLALEAIMTEGRPFPPSLPEFVSLCRQFARRGPHQLALVDKSGREGPTQGFASLKAILAKARPAQ